MLSDSQIRELAQLGAIEPFDESNLQPASYDMTLADGFVMQTGGVICPQKWSLGVEQSERSGKISLEPGQFILGSTQEFVRIPKCYAARFEGKSSLGRIGLTTHQTAGFIDPGFEGNITVELRNESSSSIVIWPGMKIGQICFFKLDLEPDHAYGESLGSHYQGQTGVTPSYICRQ